MNQFEFLSELAKSLAWPAVVLLAVIFFALPLRRLIDGLSSVELSAGKLRIRREFRAAAESTKDAISELKEEPRPQRVSHEEPVSIRQYATSNPWLELAAQSPTIAVIRAWEGLSLAIFELAEATTQNRDLLATELRVGLTETLEVLREQAIVNPSFVEAVEELRSIRNRATQGQAVPNEAEAASFISSAWELVRACKAIKTIREATKGKD